jgi:hypothetical protein
MRSATNRDQALLVEAEATLGSPPFITLKWVKNELAVKYRIQRKMLNADGWDGDLVPSGLDSSINTYEDRDVQVGEIYEYKVYAQSYGQFNEKINGKDTVLVEQFYAYGYVCAGINGILPPSFGKTLILVDNTIAPLITAELATLKNDLVLDGWEVVVKNTQRAEKFDGAAVKATKQIISDENDKEYDKLKAVILIGRVPVPYSGNLNPDAHPDHKGAWPADLYYGSFGEDNWSDNSINNSVAGRAENKNIPGDGKFDQSLMPSLVSLQVGRIDFYNMTDFKVSELDLIKNYLDKDHKFRIGLSDAQYKCIVDDNFGGYPEGFATSGWRIASLVGTSNIKADDFFTSLETTPMLWAYGCGGGNYTGAGGVGSTADFIAKSPKGVFTMLFGSYFGDWDAQNAFMRAAIASSPSVLTCSWAGRPQWFYHHMGMGLPIGYSAVTTQNNSSMYQSNYMYSPSYPGGIIYTIGIQQVHQALMGDPTLRMYMSDPIVPKTLSAYQPNGSPVKLSWDVVMDDILGYNIYKSTNGPDGPFEKINNKIINQSTNTYTDSTLFEGEVFYMLRTQKITKSKSGTFINQSRGIVKNLIVTGVNDISFNNVSIKCQPNPAITTTNLSLELGFDTFTRITICDVNGIEIRQIVAENLSAGNHEFMWDLSQGQGGKVPAGVYFVKLETASTKRIEKIVVMP